MPVPHNLVQIAVGLVLHAIAVNTLQWQPFEQVVGSDISWQSWNSCMSVLAKQGGILLILFTNICSVFTALCCSLPVGGGVSPANGWWAEVTNKWDHLGRTSRSLSNPDQKKNPQQAAWARNNPSLHGARVEVVCFYNIISHSSELIWERILGK